MKGPRRERQKLSALETPEPVHPIGTPPGLSTNTGPLAAASWLVARELFPKEPKWFVRIAFVHAGSRFELEIFSEEWGFVFEHRGGTSWIRVTDIPFVHGRDDHALLETTPPLRNIGALLRSLESRYALAFDRAAIAVETSIDGGETAIRAWAETL